LSLKLIILSEKNLKELPLNSPPLQAHEKLSTEFSFSIGLRFCPRTDYLGGLSPHFVMPWGTAPW